MKTLILCTAVTTLGLFGCSHSQQVSRSSANELPYQQHFKHGHGPRTAPADQAECAPESSNAEQ